jgi:hypothetical protein
VTRFRIRRPGFAEASLSRRAARAAGAALVAGAALGLRRLHAAPPVVEPRREYLENEHVRLGIDLSIGGSITFLASVESGVNLVNSHDWGRQVQMSYYAAPVPFEPRGKRPSPHWARLGWNPVQSGDAFGYPSEVLEFRRERDSLFVATRPMHWPLENEPAECVFESRLSLEGAIVRASCRVKCDRSDQAAPVPRDQELPAVYTNGAYHRLLTYSGERPFAGERLTEVAKRSPAEGWGRFDATERWAALVDEDGFGLGVLSPETTTFLGGFSGEPGSGGEREAPCGYIAPIRQETLDAAIEHAYRYSLVVGTVEEIRDAARKEFAGAPLPAWRFGPGRSGWNLRHATDAGYPFEDSWAIVPHGDDPQILGPPTFWRAEQAKRLRIEAACEGGAGDAELFIQPLARSSPLTTKFELDPGPGVKSYEIPLDSIAGYAGGMRSLRIDPPEGCRRLRLRSVALLKA